MDLNSVWPLSKGKEKKKDVEGVLRMFGLELAKWLREIKSWYTTLAKNK